MVPRLDLRQNRCSPTDSDTRTQHFYKMADDEPMEEAPADAPAEGEVEVARFHRSARTKR